MDLNTTRNIIIAAMLILGLITIIPIIIGGLVLGVLVQVFGLGTWTLWNAFLLGCLIIGAVIAWLVLDQ